MGSAQEPFDFDRPFDIDAAAGDRGDAGEPEPQYYTARHLLEALRALDEKYLDRPLVLIHGKSLHKPNLVQGLIPALTPISRSAVDSKAPSLLTLGELVDPPQPS